MSGGHTSGGAQDFEEKVRCAKERAKERAKQNHEVRMNGSAPGGGTAADVYPYTLLRDLVPNLHSQFVIKDLIPRKALGEVHAAPGDGKTAIVLDLCLHVAAGFEYRGRRVECQPVVYVAMEGHAGIGNRTIAPPGNSICPTCPSHSSQPPAASAIPSCPRRWPAWRAPFSQSTAGLITPTSTARSS